MEIFWHGKRTWEDEAGTMFSVVYHMRSVYQMMMASAFEPESDGSVKKKLETDGETSPKKREHLSQNRDVVEQWEDHQIQTFCARKERKSYGIFDKKICDIW